MENFEVWEAV